MAKGMGLGAANDSAGIGGPASPAVAPPAVSRGVHGSGGHTHTGPAIGDGAVTAPGTTPTGVPNGKPSTTGGTVGFASAKAAMPDLPPVMGRDGKPLPPGCTGELSAVSPKEWAKIEASAERMRYTLPFRLFRSAAHGVASGAVAVVAIPSRAAKLVGKGLDLVGAQQAGAATKRFATKIGPADAQATLDAQAPKTWEGKAASFVGETAAITVAGGALGLQGMQGTAAKKAATSLKAID